MSNRPLVTIISPCYNGEKYLLNFFDSVLAQDYPNIELIFVNDGSCDRTESIALAYTKKFRERGFDFRYICQENAGQAAAVNQGLAIFSGEYLMWMDSDDILYPNHVSEKIAFLEAHPEYGFMLAQGEEVSADALDVPLGVLRRKKPESEDRLFEDLIFERNVVFGPGTIMVRRSAVLEAIPSRKIYESREGQNWQLMLPLSYLFRCGYLDKVLFKYVAHSDSHSRRHRNYPMLLTRYAGFETLMVHTVNAISQMSEDEKQKWRKAITIQCTLKRLVAAYRYFKFRAIREEKRRLAELGYRLKENETFFAFWTVGIKRKLSRFMHRK